MSQYRLIAYAVDGGRTAKSTSVNIVVNVDDVDDNPPAFASDTLIYHVSENFSPGKVFAKIEAKDPDLQPNAEIRYEILSDPLFMNTFDLDSLTGELFLLGKLDFETRREYDFIVTASSNNLVNQVRFCVII